MKPSPTILVNFVVTDTTDNNSSTHFYTSLNLKNPDIQFEIQGPITVRAMFGHIAINIKYKVPGFKFLSTNALSKWQALAVVVIKLNLIGYIEIGYF